MKSLLKEFNPFFRFSGGHIAVDHEKLQSIIFAIIAITLAVKL